ncbi:uncharacterized protein FIBRA_04326 [Fibroporia radiculosa]|uniref:Glucose receptor Git3 N-terminal domain-containing protein n=1 Tax=Fibroporia radiculosa TaxID=599839 RepID=J4GP21_9APHY|nr:uncharacterized protein FIBRA_04326 [Fibroporia radiculosa]CCM02245.1 predicted protein [Fibroporia radiculosa]
MSSPNCSQLPDPFNELSYVPISLVRQFQIGQFILAGSTGAMIWELLSNLSNDHALLFKHKINISTIVYYISRISTLAYVLVSVIFETAATGHCRALQKVDTTFMGLSVSSTCFLFYFRVAAVFNRNRYVMAGYLTVWLGVVGGSAALIASSTGGTIGPTEYCWTEQMYNWGGVIEIMVLIHDAVVFFGISGRLMRNAYIDLPPTKRMRSFLFGDYLQPISKALLRDGQLYYVVKIACDLPLIILFYITSLSLAYRTYFTIPGVILMNAVACYIYRNARFSVGQGAQSSRTGSETTTAYTVDTGINTIRIMKTTEVEHGKDYKIDTGEVQDIGSFSE